MDRMFPVQTYHQDMNNRRMISEMTEMLNLKGNPIFWVLANIDGQEYRLVEWQVRFLQVKFKREYLAGAKLNDLKKKYIIYSGQSEKSPKMIWRKDGKFKNEFQGNFYDLNANLAFELF